MSNKLVTVPQGDNPSDTATLLLAAAESENLGPNVVRSDTQGTSSVFVVPENVAQVALGKDAEGVEEYEDPWENIRSGEVVSAYPQQGAEAEIDGSGADDSDESESKKATKKAAAKKSDK